MPAFNANTKVGLQKKGTGMAKLGCLDEICPLATGAQQIVHRTFNSRRCRKAKVGSPNSSTGKSSTQAPNNGISSTRASHTKKTKTKTDTTVKQAKNNNGQWQKQPTRAKEHGTSGWKQNEKTQKQPHTHQRQSRKRLRPKQQKGANLKRHKAARARAALSSALAAGACCGLLQLPHVACCVSCFLRSPRPPLLSAAARSHCLFFVCCRHFFFVCVLLLLLCVRASCSCARYTLLFWMVQKMP